MNSQYETRRPSSSMNSLLQESSVMTDKQEKSINREEALLNKLKKSLIEVYKQVKKHVKEKRYTFEEKQLLEIYQGISSNLKSIDKRLSEKTEFKHSKTSVSDCNNSSQLITEGTTHVQESNPFSDVDSIVSESIKLSEKSIRSKNVQSESVTVNSCTGLKIKIKALEKEMQQSKEVHSQQIRNMIQSHEEEIIFLKQQHEERLQHLKSQVQKSFEAKLEIQVQQVKMEAQERLSEEIEKIKLQRIASPLQQSPKSSPSVNQTCKKDEQFQALQAQIVRLSENFIQKEQKYKNLLVKYAKRLKDFKEQHERIISKEVQAKLSKLQYFLNKVQMKISHERRKQHQKPFIAELLQTIQLLIKQSQSLTISPAPKKQSKIKTAPENSSNIQNHCITENQEAFSNDPNIQLESLLVKAMSIGLFCEANRDNINRLIDLFISCSSENIEQIKESANKRIQKIQGSAIYPLIFEKIKLAVSLQQKTTNIAGQLESSSGNPEAQISFEGIGEHGECFRKAVLGSGRHIQSLEELDVSDSLMSQFQDLGGDETDPI